MNKYLIFIILVFVSINLAYGQRQGYSEKFMSAQQIRNYYASNISSLDPLEGEYDVEFSYKTNSPFASDGRFLYIWYFVKRPQQSEFDVYSSRNGKFEPARSIGAQKIGATNAYRMYWGESSSRGVLDNNIRLTTSIELTSGDAKKLSGNSSFAYRLFVEYDIIKRYPTSDMYAISRNRIEKEDMPIQWTGTGFALMDNYIVTNNHVVDGAKTISIQGVNGNFYQKYNAKVVAVDRINDLAILKVIGINISTANIPYSVKVGTSEVGEEVFVLGYPLTSTMGDEIKLTTGVISSKSGFQGDVSIYQISAPIQPGNSGGPLFDNIGNVIGIVSAKHKGAESVGYAIKTSYLKNLMESTVSKNILPQTNKMKGQNLSGKVKMVKNYIYYITCSR